MPLGPPMLARSNILLMACTLAAIPAFAQITDGDAHYANRAAGRDGSKADPAQINLAITAYENALASDPQSLEAAWKLARALRFKALHVRDLDTEEKASAVARALKVLDQGYVALQKRIEATGGNTKFVRESYWGDRTLLPAELDEFAKAVASVRDADRLIYEDVKLVLAFRRNWRFESALRRRLNNQRAADMAVVLMASGSEVDDDGPARALGAMMLRYLPIDKVEGEKSRDAAGSKTDALRYLRSNAEKYPLNMEARMYLAVGLLATSEAEWKTAEVIRALKAVINMTADPEKAVEQEYYREYAEEILYNPKRNWYDFTY